MLLEEKPAASVSPQSDDWVPPGWGTDEQNAAEAREFNAFTRRLRPVDG